MTKPRRDSKRENLIQNEVIVDAYNAEEQVMGWYYYLEGRLRFPFRAKCVTSRVVSPLRKGEVGDVSRMAPEDACSGDMLALIRWQGRNVAVPLSQLVPLGAEESTIEAIGDWHYWVARGYRF
jgi:Calcium binding